jgi:deazaflavin-dependent oxidoreductase (nitroreductase family)
MFKLTGALHTALYRLTGGRIGGRLYGAPVLLLTTRGRKTGKTRTTPLLYLEDGDRLVVVASKGGAPRHPAWFLNLTADPEVTVERGRERLPMRAHEADEEERARYWPQVVAMYPGYAGYQEKTSRRIPLVVLEPRPS